MLSILTSGLPLSAKDLLLKASNTVFGEGTVELVDLTKDNLRQRVRLSKRNVADVLVILDEVSADICKDIEDGLYSSDKFYKYSDDAAFVEYLNNKYSLSLELVKESMEVSNSKELVNNELLERLQSKIADLEGIIINCNKRIQELTNIIDTYGYSEGNSQDREEIESLKKDNLALRSSLADLEIKGKSSEELIISLRNERDELQKSIEKLENRKKSLLADFKSVSDELTDYKTKYSTQSGLLDSRESEIEVLKNKLLESSNNNSRVKLLLEEKTDVVRQLNNFELENSKLKLDLESKQREIDNLKKQIDSKDDYSKSELVEAELSKALSDKDALAKQVSDLQKELVEYKNNLSNLQTEYDSINANKEDMQSTISSLESRLKKSDETLIQLNKEKLELSNRVSILEKSTDRDADIEAVMSEYSKISQKYESLSNSVFSKISSLSLPKNSTPITLIEGKPNFSNIRFVFSGNTESRKGTYKCLLDEFRHLPSNERVLIVDCVSETSVDYVFEIERVVSGIDWFRKGGGVQPYLSNTCLKNVQVLTPGLTYINDAYFLTIDWLARLNELEKSGYNVVLYCGDISNLFGRILHESFAHLGTSMIYTHGNSIGARTIILNLKGITNSKESIICYFELNRKMQRFYEIVNKTNECRILSVV